MRISDEEYFRSCVAKERQLAYLLGHRNIEECYENAGTLWENTTQLPKWTRDWHACGPLMARYGIDVVFVRDDAHDGPPSVVRAGATNVHIKDHPNAERATMVAIVRELIHRLEHHQVAPKH